MIASVVIGALLIVTGLVLLRRPRVWGWAGDQIALRSVELWPPEDRDRILGGYGRILRGVRRLAPYIFLPEGLAVLLLMDTALAAMIGGAFLIIVAGVLGIFRRFLPNLPFVTASAVLFAGGGIGIAVGFTGRLMFSVGAGLAFGAAMMVSLAGVGVIARLFVRRMPTTGDLAGEMGGTARWFFLLAYLLVLGSVLAPGIGLAVAIGVPWPFIGVWLALVVSTCIAAAWFGLRAARRRRA